mgnify:CR=1 FL=1|jgi:hypothetical protein
MAYEASEIMTATALQYTSSELKKIKKKNQLQDLIKEGLFVPAGVQFGNSTIEAGFLKLMDPDNDKRVADMAVGVSAALAIRNYINTSSSQVITYMTGNVWPKEVEDFQVSAYGFADYNSSDIVVRKVSDNNKFYGISLKKKKTVKAADPTLINKTFSSAFDGKEFDKLKEELVETRINYFADIVIEAVENGIIAKKDIKNFDTLKTSNKKELFEAKNRDKNQFGKRAYIDTKGWAMADKGYLEDKTTDPKSMRYFVNSKLADKTNNKLWEAFETMMDKGGAKLGENLINIILKQNLFKEIESKELKDKKFDFALVTGIASVTPKGIVNIQGGNVVSLKTTLCGLSRIENQYPGNYEVVQDVEATNKSSAAKIFFKLIKGKLNLLDLEVRYKGSFTPRPQFQGGMNKQFKTLLDKECSGGPG